VSSLDQAAAAALLEHASTWCAERAAEVVVERECLAADLAACGFDVYASAANLLLVRRADSQATYRRLAEAGISVRNFGTVGPLANCLRITIGTRAENAALLDTLRAHPDPPGTPVLPLG
jgi:histidinol-phosphate aminotransferase